jgi:phage antirepressor YoqD-like protein
LIEDCLSGVSKIRPYVKYQRIGEEMNNNSYRNSSIGSGSTLIEGGYAAIRATANKTIKELNDRIAGCMVQVEFAEIVQKSCDNIFLNDFAKILCDKSFSIGGRRLFSLLRKERVLMKSNMPYQRFIDCGYFVVTETLNILPKKTKLRFTPLITPKGQVWLAKKVREWVEDPFSRSGNKLLD